MRKQNTSIFDMLSKMKSDIEAENSDINAVKYIPDIITFCYSPEFLNLKEKNITLRPFQEIVLKIFYRGSVGNETLSLTEDEIALCKRWGLDDEARGNTLGKYYTKDIFRELVLAWGRRCVGEETKIVDPKTGKIDTIGNIWDSGTKEITSYSMSEETYRISAIEGSDIIYNGIQPTYKMVLSDGRFIEATDNHPFLTIGGWKNLSDLKKGDRIAVPRSMPIFGTDNSTTVETAALIGYMTGDGCARHGRTCFTTANNDILEDFRHCLSTISEDTRIKQDIYTSAESKQYQYVITKTKKSTAKNALQILLNEYGVGNSLVYDKFVPEAILASPEPIVKAYLKALFSCDGSLCKLWSKRDKKHKHAITFTTVSKKLAYGVHHLLVRFGIFSRLRKRINIKSNFKSCGWAYEIDITDRKNVLRYLEKIGFTGKNNLVKEVKSLIDDLNICENNDNSYVNSVPKEIWKHIDSIKNGLQDKNLLEMYNNKNVRCHRKYSPNRYKIKKINEVLKDKYVGNVCDDNIVWLPIKSIEKSIDQRTFDISVNDDNSHNFVANDIICHNSGKDFCGSLIATYEAMRLLECPGGDPYAIYNISQAAPISILTIANSAPQAGTAFKEIRDRILGSKYFKNKIGIDGLETSKIYLLTQRDRQENQELAERGLSLKKGSVIIEVGHSNSVSLLGKGVFVLILDEVASYKKTGGSSSGEQIYTNLTPTLNTYNRPVKVLDEKGKEILGEDGKPKTKVVYDSKIISISSPLGEEGIFYELYKETPKVSTRLSCRLPTWAVVEALTEESLREANNQMTDLQFMMQFGAEFAGTGGESFFPRQNIEDCFKPGYKVVNMGKPGIIYFAHLDPATSSHNYALVIVHREMFFNEKTKKNDFNIIVDHIKYWHPTHDTPINVDIIDDYVINLRRKFYFGLVTYDIWNSSASISKLKKFGIPAKCTHYNRKYKNTIYDELYHLVISGRIKIPPHSLLRDEMINLQRRFVPPTGYAVFPRKDGEVCTDDIVDALSGACFGAISFSVNKLPCGQLVNTGSSPSSNCINWNSMSGPIGYGTGAQVAHRLERINSWPNSKR